MDTMRYLPIACVALACLLLLGCGLDAQFRIDEVITDYHRLAPQIHIGDSKERVTEILGPLQGRLGSTERKPSQAFQQDGKLVEILYFRTQRIPDGLTTDDEFTPYIFIEGKLQGIGWTALGIPITRVSYKNHAILAQWRSLREQSHGETVPNSENAKISAPGLLQHGLLSPYTPNAYGPGINMDATGRPFMWQPQWGGSGFPDPTLQVKPDAYGLGVGMDQYGRPVRPACPPGWAGPC